MLHNNNNNNNNNNNSQFLYTPCVTNESEARVRRVMALNRTRWDMQCQKVRTLVWT